ncbi:MAG TPA: DnaJ family domain-containing protein [Desulfobacterales bacterium]|nr:DnaJ family domain-containing protein [Desulfobacterales bacterium]
MITGFEKIVEERIRRAFEEGEFDDLAGRGEPLALADDSTVPEELRLAFKILKNADCLPPEVELRKEIERTEDIIAAMPDTVEKYRALKRLNFLIMKLNAIRRTSIGNEVPQRYALRAVERLEKRKSND